MRCEHIRSRLPIYTDGEMLGAAREEVAAHLEACPACSAELAELQVFLFDTREALTPPEPTYNFSQLARKMECVTPLDEIRAYLPKLRAHGPVGQLAAAALLVAIIIATPFVQRTGRQTLTAAKTPFDAQVARLENTYAEYFDEERHQSRRS